MTNGFTDTRFQGEVYEIVDGASRTLQIAIPTGSMTMEQLSVIQEVSTLAAKENIVIEFIPIP